MIPLGHIPARRGTLGAFYSRSGWFILTALLSGCSVTTRTVTTAQQVAAWDATYVPAKGSHFAAAYADLRSRLERAGVDVTEAPNLTYPGTDVQAWGLTFEKHIVLEATVDVDARLEILAHEGGHLFHTQLTKAQAEVFAEIVGARVLAFYGVKDAWKKSGLYLASFKGGLSSVRDLQADMDRAVAALTGQSAWPELP